LFEANKALAFHTANRHRGRLEQEDANQVALSALWSACETWDESRGSLSTLASVSIRHALWRASARAGRQGQAVAFSDIAEDGVVEQAIAGDEGRTEARDAVAIGLDVLHAKARQVIVQRFGIGCVAMNRAQCAAMLNITEARVGQVERSALATMRESLISSSSAVGMVHRPVVAHSPVLSE
jgi:RNA polymerase sigma factor (sigma-70 family)